VVFFGGYGGAKESVGCGFLGHDLGFILLISSPVAQLKLSRRSMLPKEAKLARMMARLSVKEVKEWGIAGHLQSLGWSSWVRAQRRFHCYDE